MRQSLITEAERANKAEDHSTALTLAAQAGQIRMTPSLRLFIAQEQIEVGQLANSFYNAEVCVFEVTQDKALKHRKEILRTCKDLMADIQKSAARIILSLPNPVPPQARVLIGSLEVEESLYGRPYFVSPGLVRIEASAPGYLPYQHELEVEAKEEVTLMVSLPPEPSTLQALQRPVIGDSTVGEALNSQLIATREPVVVSPTAENRTAPSVAPYLLLGAGAASLGTSVVFLVLRNNALSAPRETMRRTDHFGLYG